MARFPALTAIFLLKTTYAENHLKQHKDTQDTRTYAER